MNNRSLIILLFYFMYKFGDEKSNRITINIALWESCIFIQDWTKSLHHHSAEEKKNKLKYFISITHIFFLHEYQITSVHLSILYRAIQNCRILVQPAQVQFDCQTSPMPIEQFVHFPMRKSCRCCKPECRQALIN